MHRWRVSSSSETTPSRMTTRRSREGGACMVRLVFRGAVVAGVLAISVLLLAVPAQAHAGLIRAQPANGATLARAPSQALLWFDEELVPEFSSGQLVDARGRTVPGTAVDPGRGDRTLLVVSLPAVPA